VVVKSVLCPRSPAGHFAAKVIAEYCEAPRAANTNSCGLAQWTADETNSPNGYATSLRRCTTADLGCNAQ
jgi:hypothetical protein